MNKAHPLQEEISQEDLEDELELHDIQATVEQISPKIFVPQPELSTAVQQPRSLMSATFFL